MALSFIFNDRSYIMATFFTGVSPDCNSDQLDPHVLDNMRRSLNKSVARRILKTFDDDPSLDFESVLRDALATYKRRFDNGIASSRKRAS